MNAPQRLGLYGAGLAALFVATFAVAGAVVPESSVAAWSTTADGEEAAAMEDMDGMEGMDMGEEPGASGATPVRGLSLEQDGLLLSPVSVPGETGDEGMLSFSITSADGEAVTEFETAHDKKLHLIVVRTDGAQFRHVHPTMSADGVWSIPWTWDAAGSYRVFTDFVPAATGENVTLSRGVDVAGRVSPEPATAMSASDTTGGYTATLAGDLSASGDSTLTATISKDGEPVTGLEPYLGAYGHLVALRDGDLAYLHVHPEGDEPEPGSVSGPDVTFMTQAPTPGRYLLYLDFKVDGEVRTAHFVLDTTGGEAAPADDAPADEHGH
ncbi:heavy-metal-associated domain-containing protein [Promicromonospora sp. NPDC057138]|uniref:heavy-metal-associated domain-containing protein n=1 Tax=Promicromonospora sp. NPDC057138 TaxID=3346031 RepID=UPI003630CF5B